MKGMIKRGGVNVCIWCSSNRQLLSLGRHAVTAHRDIGLWYLVRLAGSETSLGVTCAGHYRRVDSHICKGAPCRRPTQELQSNTNDFGDTSTLILETLLELARGLTWQSVVSIGPGIVAVVLCVLSIGLRVAESLEPCASGMSPRALCVIVGVFELLILRRLREWCEAPAQIAYMSGKRCKIVPSNSPACWKTIGGLPSWLSYLWMPSRLSYRWKRPSCKVKRGRPLASCRSIGLRVGIVCTHGYRAGRSWYVWYRVIPLEKEREPRDTVIF